MPDAPDIPAAPVALDVGLTDEDRHTLYYTPEGSELYPFPWFRALRVLSAPGKPYLRDRLHTYGFLYATEVESPWGLPIGMTVAETPDTRFAKMKMLGVNCAACHVGAWTANGTTVLVDGAPNLVDMNAFYKDLLESTVMTALSPADLWEFVRRVESQPRASREAPSTPGLAGEVRVLLNDAATLEDLEQRGAFGKALADEVRKAHRKEMAREAPDPTEAFGTTPEAAPTLDVIEPDADAFKDIPTTGRASGDMTAGQLGQQTVAHVMKTLRLLRARAEFLIRLGARNVGTVPGPGRVDAFGNARNVLFDTDIHKLKSPVSIPHLWNFSAVQWLHWDANTNSIMERNIGQALGLGAVFDKNTFVSTIRPRDIHRLETVARKIKPPKWPAAWGQPDPNDVTNGKAVYATRCMKCHAFENTDLTLDKIGTDKNRANSFPAPVGGVDFPAKIAPILTQLKNRAYVDAKVTPEEAATFDHDVTPVWRKTLRYPGRRLEGIWASPPYLHNGSVATLWDITLPAAKRRQVFHLGTRKYDTEKLGLVGEESAGAFRLQVDVVGDKGEGNFAGGHEGPEYGTLPPEQGGMTDEERRVLMEFMKSL